MGLMQRVVDVYEDAKSLTYAVKNLVPEAKIGLWYGDSQAYKTFVVLDYLLHRAYGMPWCGLKTKQAIGCFVSAEGASGVWKRIKAWHDVRSMNFKDCPLMIIPMALVLPDQINDLVADFRDFHKRTGENIGDLTIDTFSQTFSGNENQADNVAGYFNTLQRKITHPFRCTTNVIHHTGRSGENPRGSYTFEANIDFRFKIERGKSERLTTLTVEKQKDDLELPPLSFHLTRHQVGLDLDGEPITSLAPAYVSDPAKFEAAIADSPQGVKKVLLDIAELGLTVDQSRRQFMSRHEGNEQTSRRAWNRTLKSLIDYGLISIEGGKLVRCVNEKGAEIGT